MLLVSNCRLLIPNGVLEPRGSLTPCAFKKPSSRILDGFLPGKGVDDGLS